MKLGIVGHEAAKFTPETEDLARLAIIDLILKYEPNTIVSGHCHLGGIDIWAEEIGADFGIDLEIHTPKQLRWDAEYGFKARNLDIARADVVACVVVRKLPKTYRGMRFSGCYHCRDRNPPHVKSGGCWTAWQAKRNEWRIV